MASNTSDSLGSRLYALLLYLYPSSFRRAYGEAMVQVFNDQRRLVSGPGGYAMLWLKTLRDLVLSVPAVHSSNDRSGRPSKGGAFVWTLLMILGVVFLLNAMILPSMIGRTLSGDAVAVVDVETPGFALTGQYRAIAQVAAGGVATVLALGAFLFAARQRSLLTGAATFVAGATLTFMALAMSPWLWSPLDRYPAALTWALGVWPLAAAVWAALLIVRQQQPKA